MAIQTTYTQAREHLAALCDEATINRQVIIIRRRGAEDVALVSAADLNSLIETAYLLQSPKNAKRLMTALERARRKSGAPESLTDLRHEVGLDQA
jgi:antitoxin YefM